MVIMGDIPAYIVKAADYIPFLSTMAPSARTGDARPLITRLMEQGILAFGAAFFTLQISDTKQTAQLTNLERRVEEIKTERLASLEKQLEALHGELRNRADATPQVLVLQAQMADIQRRLDRFEQMERREVRR